MPEPETKPVCQACGLPLYEDFDGALVCPMGHEPEDDEPTD